MTKLTKVRRSGFKDQVSVGDPSFPAPRSSLLGLASVGRTFPGREALGLCHLPKVLPRSLPCSLHLLPALLPALLPVPAHGGRRPVLLWRQEVRAGLNCCGLRPLGAVLPRDVPLEPCGLAELRGPSTTHAGPEGSSAFVQPPGEPGPLGKEGPSLQLLSCHFSAPSLCGAPATLLCGHQTLLRKQVGTGLVQGRGQALA